MQAVEFADKQTLIQQTLTEITKKGYQTLLNQQIAKSKDQMTLQEAKHQLAETDLKQAKQEIS